MDRRVEIVACQKIVTTLCRYLLRCGEIEKELLFRGVQVSIKQSSTTENRVSVQCLFVYRNERRHSRHRKRKCEPTYVLRVQTKK
jgi:hypothetical protein